MPHLNLHLSPAPGTAPELGGLARQLTQLTERHLDKDPTLTAVRIAVQAATQWFIGGQSLAEAARASYHLEVQVTAGTNSEDQIAAWLADVHAALAQALGALHPTSYAVVQQLPAAAWGYGGKSQAQRRLERLQAA
jgi:4-oxalocrotonate tautomerase